MSDRLSEKCLYCGSDDVLDDAWFCDRIECYAAYENEDREGFNQKLRACGLMVLVDDSG